MNWRRIRNLDITLRISALQISIIPFRWARPALRTSDRVFGRKEVTQAFFGPVHVWTFPSYFNLGIEASLQGRYHGRATMGENTFKFYWKKWFG